MTGDSADRDEVKMRSVAVVALTGVLSLLALPALAHHSAAPFDPAKTITLSGVVQDFEYANPHSWLVIDVMDSGGKVSTWSFESQGPAFLLRLGIKKSDFPAGTSVTVTGHPMRNGTHAASFMKAVRADGKVFGMRRARPIHTTTKSG
ncbi:MAG: DUF6152 family protein [Steroidobacteraceae bacterium]